MPRTRLRRLRELQVDDRAALDELLDTAIVGHVGVVVDGEPVVVPTAVARDGDRVLVHGSTGSGWMRRVAEGVPSSLTVTSLEGVIVARSVFESSLRYRSAVLFGRFAVVDGDEKEPALAVVVDKLVPGRSAEVRPSTAGELRRTLVLAMPIARWSLKVSSGWSADGPADLAGPAWAGVVPLHQRAGAPEPAPDLAPGIPVPPSVRRLARRRGVTSPGG
ncbi:MAG: pyridoxamine 5'-phosphate oxidase family protein [Acidimicrobiales bacterium]